MEPDPKTPRPVPVDTAGHIRPGTVESDSRGSHPRKGMLVSLRWPLVVVLLGLFALIAYLVTLSSARQAAGDAARAVSRAAREVGGLAERFRTGTVTTRFLAAIPKLTPTGNGNLELATAVVTETFSRTDERRIFWDSISLGQTTAEIKVPVTYRYHVRLSDPWTVEVKGQTCVVRAPRLRPSLPPAIHTDQMEKRTREGWLRFDASDQLEQLERSITPTLEAYASDPQHLDLVREECRRTVARFVRSWLMLEEQWESNRIQFIVVTFADDQPSPEDYTPTLQLNQ